MKKVVVITSGGDAPGMNAALYGIVKKATEENIEVYGAKCGYIGIIEENFVPLTIENTFPYLRQGGTILETIRFPAFQEKEVQRTAVEIMEKHDFDALIVIGGDGSYKGAAKLSQFYFPVIAIPATIDNDIFGTENSLGFSTAVSNATAVIDKLSTTAASHGHIFVVEVMGRHSGNIAKKVGKAVGADMTIIPEKEFTTEEVIESLDLSKKQDKKYSMIVTAEGAISCLELTKNIERNSKYKVHPLILGHIQRGGDPACEDRILGIEFGEVAIKLLKKKKYGIALRVYGGKIDALPLSEYL
ncbi:6-phosphofructokinase 1 [Pilibacter termitis]|uniref:6-phosphofructokinase n=1 Tax=Pilibacter termitis TaxID=263852 RepID=A0A1T4LYW8_9ENTE|nr:ATP-dependent 6-phosphofructokinase [Pilibacter termitis]SJZ59933.1 6-phosphofructokinase 1 [Pilibacter termitis]